MYKLAIKFSSNIDKEYYPVVGTTFSNSYQEELDSATVVLAQIYEENRLNNISPYEFVKIWDKSDDSDFEKYFIVDNFNESKDNVYENIYSYTIYLMSETKFLEKIQCPNLAITHRIEGTRKTIFDYIWQYCELYIPKVKFTDDGTNWYYKPLFEIKREKKIHTFSYRGSNFVEGTYPGGYTYTLDDVEWEIGEDLNDVYDLKRKIIATLNITDSLDIEIINFNVDSEHKKVTFSLYFERTSIKRIFATDRIQVNVAFDYVGEMYHRFNVIASDMTLTAPTFRQLLTSLMQQVGCIPTVKNRVLSYLDFQVNDEPFAIDGDQTIDGTVIKEERSLSSDSYANTLITLGDQVLDSGNAVISEKIGFRDRNNVLLKQDSNLLLTTSFPIYNVNKLTANFLLNKLNEALQEYQFDYLNDYCRISTNFERTMLPERYNLNIHIERNQYANKSIKTDLKVCVFINTEENKLIALTTNSGYYPHDPLLNIVTDLYSSYIENESISFDVTSFDDLSYIVYGKIYFYDDGDEDTRQVIHTEDIYSVYLNKVGYEYVKADVTKLVRENSIRSTLNNNFVEMNNAQTIDDLSQFVYGTFGFSIGSNQIRGFSDTYSEIPSGAWWNQTYTYLENIYNFIVDHNLFDLHLDSDTIIHRSIYDENDNVILVDIHDIVLNANLRNESYIYTSWQNYFGYTTFDIEYQPLNSFNMKYVKDNTDDIPINISQYNSSASGVTDFDRLSLNEQEQVNRIGNETVFISQRARSFDQLRQINTSPLYYVINGTKYTIFKQTFSIDYNFISVNYVASKDAILKDYFTSIRTKYRAYEYVDYSSSVIRKENETIYCFLSRNIHFDGDNHIKNLEDYSVLIDGIVPNISYSTNDKKIIYSYEGGDEATREENPEYCKNEVSVITTRNILAFTYQNFDNNSAGVYIESTKRTLGGMVQGWQVWGDKYFDKHVIGYLTSIGSFSFNDAIKFPIITNLDYSVSFNLVDDNRNADNQKTYYKDKAEIINQTTEFIYYTDEPERYKWSEKFISGGSLVSNGIGYINAYYYGNNLNINDFNSNAHNVSQLVTDFDLLSSHQINVAHIANSKNAKITINRSILQPTNESIVLCHKNSDGTVEDVFGIYGTLESGTEEIYLSLNDTKTTWVYKENADGIIYKYKRVANGNQRKVRGD